MIDDKRIKKDDKKTLTKIEEMCGPLKRTTMLDPTMVENIFNFNEDGNVIMLGFNLVDLKLDANKVALLGELVNELTPLEELIIWSSEVNNFPHWLKDIKKNNLKRIKIQKSHLTSIPEWLKECNNLERLNLAGNEIINLPDWLLTLKDLEKFGIRANPIEFNQENLNICKVLYDKSGGSKMMVHGPSAIELYLLHNDIPIEHLKIYNEMEQSRASEGNNNYSNIKVKEGQIIEWMVVNRGGEFILESLPENFGILKNLQTLTLRNSSIVSLPESIGELEELKELNLSKNHLSSLPDSFVNLTSITKLDLSNNQLTEIPTQLWALKELTDLNLSNNPLSDEEQNVIQKVPDLIRKYLRVKATIAVFISHAVIDYGPYRVGDLVDFLEKQKEISQVYFCEEDLAGNIDEWMLDAVQKCQLILFIGTNKSVFDSVDCANELQLADKFSIPVIPLKGKDVDWPDLAERNLSRELGLEYDIDNFDDFCSDVYKYVENFKREINLMEKEERRQGIIDIYERFRLMLDETLGDIRRKLDALGERITQLEKKN
ncbi:MAG: leucine-rich repeat domain-containing protein [Candidatus Lokiarchaeia archaeon]